MTPAELRSYLKENNITQWALAQRIGIHEKTFVCWLHTSQLTAERETRVRTAIDEILNERERMQ